MSLTIVQSLNYLFENTKENYDIAFFRPRSKASEIQRSFKAIARELQRLSHLFVFAALLYVLLP